MKTSKLYRIKSYCLSMLLLITSVSCNNHSKKIELVNSIQNNHNFEIVKEKAKDIIATGFSAGDGYEEVWIRDFSTFMELTMDVNEKYIILDKLLVFFKFQGDDGNIIDAYTNKSRMMPNTYDYIFSDLEPELAAHKNTVETDQETSLIQGVYKYITKSGDKDILNVDIGGILIKRRLEMALEYLVNNRMNQEYGLIWGATTADWGDVQPEHEWGVFITKDSHLTLDIYDNAMFLIAINNYLELVPETYDVWSPIANKIHTNIRKYLWDSDKKKFRPHIYLNGSPFPVSFNEDEVYYHGGTAIAIEAGLLSREEVLHSLKTMINNMDEIGAHSIGLTLYPAYPEGSFKNKILSTPYTYQNGGDWTWFGARMIQQLVKNGYIDEAYEQIQPFIDRVVKNDGFYEWYSINNEPKGSGMYRGSAGVLYKAIILLEKWADDNK